MAYFLLLCKMASRNLRRHFRRTVITLASIAFGMSVMLWLDCIMAGRNQDVVKMVTQMHIGHLQIYDQRYNKDPLLQYSFQPDAVEETLKASLPAGSTIVPRVHLPALISSGEKSMPIQFEGIMPSKEKGFTDVSSKMVAGSYLDDDASEDCSTRQILMGANLAKLLNVEVGNKVVILAQASDSTLGNELFLVKGLFDTGSERFDKSFAFAPMRCVQNVGVVNGIHEFTVKIPDGERPQMIQASVQNKLGGKMAVASWRETMPELATIVTFNNAAHNLVSFMLFFVIALGIINTMLMSVFERTREFGMMTALGTTPRQVRWVVLLESVCIAFVSIGSGLILGSLAVAYHSHYGFDLTYFIGQGHMLQSYRSGNVTYPLFSLTAYLRSSGVAVAIVLLAALYPAWRASKLNPVEAMRST